MIHTHFRDYITQLAKSKANAYVTTQGSTGSHSTYIRPGELSLSDLTTYANPDLQAWLKSNHPELFL